MASTGDDDDDVDQQPLLPGTEPTTGTNLHC